MAAAIALNIVHNTFKMLFHRSFLLLILNSNQMKQMTTQKKRQR